MIRSSTAAIALVLLAALMPASALAHGDKHNEDAKPKHGGQYQEVAGHHGVELVVEDTQIIFHLTEDHEPMDLTGSSFKAVVQNAGETKILPLSATESRLIATLPSKLEKGAKVVLTGKDKSGHTVQARFVTK